MTKITINLNSKQIEFMQNNKLEWMSRLVVSKTNKVIIKTFHEQQHNRNSPTQGRGRLYKLQLKKKELLCDATHLYYWTKTFYGNVEN